MTRHDSRGIDQLRPITVQRHFTRIDGGQRSHQGRTHDGLVHRQSGCIGSDLEAPERRRSNNWLGDGRIQHAAGQYVAP